MTALIELPLSQLTGGDVGKRVVVTRDGNAFDGMLTRFQITRSEYVFKDRPRITAVLVVKTFGNTKTTRDEVNSELELRDLPLDYLIQITDTPEADDRHPL